MRKLLFAALAVALIIGATPALAQLNGTWAGGGKGVCSPPPGFPNDFAIYAWQNWKGLVENEEVFYGDWWDSHGHQGRFKGEVKLICDEDAYSEGEWFFLDMSSDPPREYYMGPFTMKFKLKDAICYGEWKTYYSGEAGTMEGKKVD